MKYNGFSTILAAALLIGDMSLAESPKSNLKPVNQGWLESTYSDKTWEWGDGHAYFGPDGDFQAAKRNTEKAEGKWYTARGGKVCFRATWIAANASGPAQECWKHAVDEKNQVWRASVDGGFWTKWKLFDPKSELIPGNIFEQRFEQPAQEKVKIRSKPMDARALAKMYAGRTWQWSDGHAYFEESGVVTAISGKNSVGEGKWFATRRGTFCIDANWVGADYSNVRKKRCWRHVQDKNGTIWQSSTEGDGEWSRFEPGKSLTKGNIYASRFARQKQRLSR